MTIDITRTDTDRGGRFEARVDGFDEPAVLEFRMPGGELLNATHTFVPVPMRGRGVGKALVDRLVADAREQGFRIIPTCPFVKAHLERDPERVDLIASI